MNYRFMRQALEPVAAEWLPVLLTALDCMDRGYLEYLMASTTWFPGVSLVFAAFQHPLADSRYLLLGESPYPRQQSANGYAFWDAQVSHLWSPTGLNKAVNRATSLRNLLKMLLHARGDLCQDFSQAAIARLDKSRYVQTLPELFQGFLARGFVLLNASLVYEEARVVWHAKQWRPFIASLLQSLQRVQPDIALLLLGRIAQQVPCRELFQTLVAEHPYQISFIQNPAVLAFFKPLNLLEHHDKHH